MLKKWFTKRDKSCIPNSEDDLDSDIRDLKAYIVLGTDGDEDFVSVQFSSDSYNDIANLMFLLLTGGAMEECVKSLYQACESDREAQIILQILTDLVKQNTAELIGSRKGPVVDPTEVFNRKERDDYKG